MKKHKATKPRRSRPTSEASRLIFAFWDGTKERRVDPLEVQLALTTIDGFDLDLDTKLIQSDTPEAPRALRRLVDAIRKAFTVAPFDGERGTGLTHGECITLFYDFAQFIEDLKKKLGGSPISSAPTVEPSPAPSLMPSTSDSSPIAPESSPNVPPSTPPG